MLSGDYSDCSSLGEKRNAPGSKPSAKIDTYVGTTKDSEENLNL